MEHGDWGFQRIGGTFVAVSIIKNSVGDAQLWKLPKIFRAYGETLFFDTRRFGVQGSNVSPCGLVFGSGCCIRGLGLSVSGFFGARGRAHKPKSQTETWFLHVYLNYCRSNSVFLGCRPQRGLCATHSSKSNDALS